MIDHSEIKQLISLYIDGEASPDEIITIEMHLRECKACQAYVKELKNLSGALKSWGNEELSMDLENKIHRALKSQKEASKMKNTKSLITARSSGVLVALLVLILSLKVYDSGNMKMYFDKTSKKIPPTAPQIQTQVASKPEAKLENVAKTKEFEEKGQKLAKLQYEPYYLSTNYAIQGAASEGYQKSSYHYSPVSGIVSETSQEFWGGGVISYPASIMNTEDYGQINENEFLSVTENTLSTFSIDVDTASYSNVRRFLNLNQLPPVDAVRIEEMINYFNYDYPKPEKGKPFSITTKAAVCPWNKDHNLVLIGLQGKTFDEKKLPPSNLVFLIDVSGSMESPDKLPLLKESLKMMVNRLTDNERVAIVVYAGAAGLVLDSTSGADKYTINDAIDRLQAGGSTAGGAGIQLAYEIAQKNFIKNGNNRVILATDGDFNVGVSSDSELVRIIEEKRKGGVFLTILGFGTGNYKDNKMEQIADKGNGNYYYIDTLNEGKKVLIQELGSTLFTIAKDVKIQIEFNPAKVKSYRLIGYENRVLAKEDFNNDSKDAGELGAGHTVTALYEIIPADSEEETHKVDALKYQQSKMIPSDELMTLKLRYKDPEAEISQLIEQSLKINEIDGEMSADFKFASAVAEFGLLLRNSALKAQANYDQVLKNANEGKGKDIFGYKQEFIQLVEKAKLLDHRIPTDEGIQFKN